MSRSSLAAPSRRLSATSVVLFFAVAAMAFSSSAHAGPGYELDSTKSSFSLGGDIAHGVAVDQTSQLVYVAELSTNAAAGAAGQVEQFDAAGAPTVNSPFTAGASVFFTGVAVNPMTHGIYAYQTSITTPFGEAGTPRINTFSSTGALGSSFGSAKTIAAQIAADSTGRVFYPNEASDTVQVFDSAGVPKATINCAGCAGGSFNNPASVAIDSADNLYVVDLGTGRVIKFTPSGGGSYAYASVLQSGHNAVAVGVDPSNNDVFVGNLEGSGYHIVAFDSSGVQFDDFGAGLFAPPPVGVETAGQIAANATTHKLYVTDPAAKKAWIFARIASIPAPTATTDSASSLGQLSATLKATVNVNGHGLTDCHFEYTDDADFQANEYTNATSVPCPSHPGGSSASALATTINGLVPNTTYHYRVIATTNGGTAQGGNQAFTTLPANPPLVTTGAASALEQTKATISGSVNPQGGSISDCHFEYTNHADFQANQYANAKSAPCLPAKPSGTSATPVTAKIASLIPNTTYDYRIVATSNAGTSEGDDQAFTTLAETCATNPALCPSNPPVTPVSPSPPQPPVSSTPITKPAPKPFKCKKGFRKKRVKGKQRCVRIKKQGNR